MDEPLSFIQGGGEMGALIRKKDWIKTSMGDPVTWSPTLKSYLPTMLNCAFPMFIFWGKDLICFYNDAYRPSLGIEGKHPGILGMEAEEAWPEIWDIIHPLIKQVVESGVPTWSENQLIPIYRNGKIEDVYWTFSYSPIYSNEMKREGVLVTCSETTAAVLNMNHLKESREQLHFALEAAEMGTWDFNPITNSFTSNSRLKEWFGLPIQEEIDLVEATNAIIEEDRDRVIASIKKSLKYGEDSRYDINYAIRNRQTGQHRVVRAIGRAWFNENKEAFRFNGVMQDITQQSKVERENLRLFTSLETSEYNFKSLVMQSPIAMAIFRGKDHIIEIANDRMLTKMWRKKRNDVVGRKLIDVFPELKDQKYPELLNEVFNNARSLSDKESLAIVVGDDGIKEFYVDYDYSPLYDLNGSVSGVMVTVNDVTERVEAREKILKFSKKLEEEVQERTMMLRQSNIQLKATINELEEVNAELQSFAYVSSHDLQEPLRKIQMFASRILERSGDELGIKDRDDLDRMMFAAKRMRSLIDDLLAFSKISYSEEEFRETDLNQLLGEVKEDLSEILYEHKVKIESDPLPRIEGIGFQISQMMNNLIENSVKFRKEGRDPLIMIRSSKIKASTVPGVPTDKDKEYVHLEFRDNGIGFEPHYNQQIFEVFQRLHRKSEYSGTGIGLAIVKKIVNNHGGVIHATGMPGEGAKFDVYLPLYR